MTQRTFDIVLFGATGFTGKLVAEYLAKVRGARLRWALAGRNEGKLAAVRSELARIDPALADMPICVADALDPASLDALVPRARVVVSTVGPFARFGRALVSSCARHGTHYADITGEVPFIRHSIDTCHAVAEGTRARIVHACGYDSIPSDLGVHLLWDHARARGHELRWAKGFAGRTKGGLSGGTVASMLTLMEEATRDRATRRLLMNARALDPEPAARDRTEPDQRGVRFDRDIARWTAPFVMSTFNTRVVRRSNALLHYGASFRYDEAMSMPKGPKGLVLASAVTAGLASLVAVAAVPAGRALLAKAPLARSGAGPSAKMRESGYFELLFVGEAAPRDAKDGARLRLEGRVAGRGDPGYGATSRMLGESALCLLEDERDLPPRWGVLTPASAMGTTLVERLKKADFTFDVSSAAT